MDQQFEKKLKKIKIITLILYTAFCFIGLPLIFIFPPREFLFTEGSESEEDKKFLFKNFVSEIYNNINTKLIDDIILTNQSEKCPNDYEVLNIEHQYYGNFTHLFGNNIFCIKRNNDEDKIFSTILQNNKLSCESGQKPCGMVNKISQALLCVNKNDKCPLNFIDFTSSNKGENNYFQIVPTEGIYFSPRYNEDKTSSLIIDIDFIYKYRICLERYHKLETPTCEFYDNDICYIEDKFSTKISIPTINNYNFTLFPIILSKNNIKNDDSLKHDYCKNAIVGKKFNIFSKGYVNFEKKDLDNFLEEFPDLKQNNPFADILDLYKSDKNFEILFYYFSCILFIWSLLQLVLLILVFYVKKIEILDLANKAYLLNGVILFIFKLICFLVLLVSHYSFYLKFKAVYLTLDNDPRDEILSSYKNLRIIFITKVFILWIVGFITICMELIILCFIKAFIQLQTETGGEEIDIPKQEPKPQEPVQGSVHNSFKSNENVQNPKTINEIKQNIQSIDTEINNEPKTKLQGSSSPPPSVKESKKIVNPFNKIELNFRLKEKNYTIKVEPNEKFSDIEKKLKLQYPELDEKKLDLFMYDSQTIKKDNCVADYNINENADIIINNN